MSQDAPDTICPQLLARTENPINQKTHMAGILPSNVLPPVNAFENDKGHLKEECQNKSVALINMSLLPPGGDSCN